MKFFRDFSGSSHLLVMTTWKMFSPHVQQKTLATYDHLGPGTGHKSISFTYATNFGYCQGLYLSGVREIFMLVYFRLIRSTQMIRFAA